MTDPKDPIKEKLEKLVDQMATDLGKPKEYIANEMFYIIQRHKEWGRNATQAQKRASFKEHDNKCHRCGDPINSFDEATFHHLERGVPGQHQPNNLVPEHEKCHDQVHGAKKGSLTKGTPRKKR